MKKRVIISAVILSIFLILPLISSQIIINQQPNSVYNLGDIVTVSTTIKSSKSVAGFYQMDLICDGRQENFYRNGVSLNAGEEKKVEASLVLAKASLDDMKGLCKIKAFLLEDFSLTNDFKISDSITIDTTFEKIEFNPGETITLAGEASKENGDSVNGIIEFSLIEGNSSRVSQAGTINNGAFSVSIILPQDLKAGAYLIELNAYEEDINGETTNKGIVNQNIAIKQVPTNLEIVFDSIDVEPGTNVIVKAVLRDQTGEKIDSSTFISIKNSKNKILEQVEIATDEFHEFPIANTEPPSSWKVVAASNKLTKEAVFTIKEKESISISLSNKTVTITNTGNVLYNKTALVKIGNESLNVDVYLQPGENQKYILTAPEGTYRIEISSGEEKSVAESVSLTGKAIDVKKAGVDAGSLVRYPFVWVFIAIVIGAFLLILIKRSSKRSFFGHMNSEVHMHGRHVQTHHHHENHEHHEHHDSSAHHADHTQHVHHESHLIPIALTKGSLINSRNKAEISLSIKGEKQDVSVIALHIKNLGNLQKKDGSAETLQKIVDMAEDKKAATYEDSSSIIFILSPSLTRSFKNEKTALEIAQAAKGAIAHHNKMFKQKLDFGISLNHGPIIGKQEGNIFKFSSIDSTISASKKIASIAEGDILLGARMNERVKAEAKTIKHHKSGVDVYSIKEIKNSEEHAKFIKRFSENFEKEYGKEYHKK